MSRLKQLFAKRELYVRSDGEVRYVTLTPIMQLGGFFILFILLASASVTLFALAFGDEIQAFKSAKNEKMIARYKERVAELQTNYDILHNKHRITQEWFKEVTNTLEMRHNELTEIFEKNAIISSDLESMQQRFAKASQRVRRSAGETRLFATAGEIGSVHFESRASTAAHDKSQLALAKSAPFTLFGTAKFDVATTMPANTRDRVERLRIRQQELLDALEESTDQKIAEARAIIDGTYVVTADELLARVAPQTQTAIGGPYIPLNSNAPDMPYTIQKQFMRINSNLGQLVNLNKSIAHLPLAAPIHYYKVTSGFGSRIDPFNEQLAFHAGLDYGAPAGTHVHATLPGKVINSGRKGPYGLVVEIDHANGFRTRYAHLKNLRVKTGQIVDFHDIIGTVGSSGRSTGPHLHYEIWYEDKVKDPVHFIRAGKHIFPFN